jgi:formylglycine-generating enzyme required for sulfatase activity
MNSLKRDFVAKLVQLSMVLMMALPLNMAAAGSLRGDVNGDGNVSIADVTALIDVLLSGDGQYTVVADVNADNSVSISDVTALIDYLLGGGELQPIDDPQYVEIEANGVRFIMIHVEGGTYKMGATPEQGSDASSREKPVHQVTVDDFYIAQTEVTQELWMAVMGSNPSYFPGSLHPVEYVSWAECQDFITALNALTGWSFRLPSEAEWEYAARGGNQSLGYKYAGSNDVSAVAWYSGNDSWETRGTGEHGTHDVATRMPNELELYDMSGNVHEWVQDWYGDYSSGSQVNPVGPSSGTARVYRGGNWYFDEWFCRVSFRNSVSPTYHSHGIGLRLAL